MTTKGLTVAVVAIGGLILAVGIMTGQKAKPVEAKVGLTPAGKVEADLLAKIPAGKAKTELLRLRDISEKERSELLKLESANENTDCLQKGLGTKWCSQHVLYADAMQEQKQKAEEAARRYEDLKSRLLAGQ
jgi:hypothetical protein